MARQLGKAVRSQLHCSSKHCQHHAIFECVAHVLQAVTEARPCCQLMGSALLIPHPGKPCSGDSAGLERVCRRYLSSGCSTVSRRSTCGRGRVARSTTSTKEKAADKETHCCPSSSLLGQHPALEAVQALMPNKCLLSVYFDAGMQGSAPMKARPKCGTAATSVHKRTISSNCWPRRPMQELQCGESYVANTRTRHQGVAPPGHPDFVAAHLAITEQEVLLRRIPSVQDLCLVALAALCGSEGA